MCLRKTTLWQHSNWALGFRQEHVPDSLDSGSTGLKGRGPDTTAAAADDDAMLPLELPDEGGGDHGTKGRSVRRWCAVQPSSNGRCCDLFS